MNLSRLGRVHQMATMCFPLGMELFPPLQAFPFGGWLLLAIFLVVELVLVLSFHKERRDRQPEYDHFNWNRKHLHRYGDSYRDYPELVPRHLIFKTRTTGEDTETNQPRWFKDWPEWLPSEGLGLG